MPEQMEIRLNTEKQYGRFRRSRKAYVSEPMALAEALKHFHKALIRCGYRYWFLETAEGTPPDNASGWNDAFRGELQGVMTGFCAEDPDALDRYRKLLCRCYGEFLGFEPSWQLAFLALPGDVVALEFDGVADLPVNESCSGYFPLRIRLTRNADGTCVIRYEPPGKGHHGGMIFGVSGIRWKTRNVPSIL